jgi:hypothetical protein
VSPLVRKGRGLIFPHFATESAVFELSGFGRCLCGNTIEPRQEGRKVDFKKRVFVDDCC